MSEQKIKGAVSTTTPRRTALITGASSGIGKELAESCAAAGSDLILVARGQDRLEAIATDLRRRHGVAVTVIAMDLAEPGAAARLHERLTADGQVVQDLVNNAGFGQWGGWLRQEPRQETRMMQLNMVFLTEFTRLVARDMAARRDGRILNVASTAAFQPGPGMAVYYATKAYVLSFSEALASELADQGITVTALCPGPTRSGFQDAAAMHQARMLGLGMMTSEAVARAGHAGMVAGRAVVIPGVLNRLLAMSVRFTPRALVRRISGYLAAGGHAVSGT